MKTGIFAAALVVTGLVVASSAEPGAPAAPATIEIVGKVLDQDGKPVKDVRIGLSSTLNAKMEQLETTSGADGGFVLSAAEGAQVTFFSILAPAGSSLFPTALDGDVEFKVGARPFYGGSFALKPGAPNRAVVTIRMGPPTGSLAGRVTDEDGKPVAGAKVAVSGDSLSRARNETDALAAMGMGSKTFASDSGPFAMTGPDGRYTLGVPPGSYPPVRFSPPVGSMLYWPYMGGSYVRVWDGRQLEVNATMKLGGAVEVVVLGPDGRPVKGVKATLGSVRSVHVGGLPAGAEAGDDGVSRIWSIPPDNYVLKTSPPEEPGPPPPPEMF